MLTFTRLWRLAERGIDPRITLVLARVDYRSAGTRWHNILIFRLVVQILVAQKFVRYATDFRGQEKAD